MNTEADYRLAGIMAFSIIPMHFLPQRLWLCELNCDWRGPEVAEQDSKSLCPPSPALNEAMPCVTSVPNPDFSVTP